MIKAKISKNITYHGRVSLKIRNADGTVIKQIKYKNKGCEPLFRFVAYAFAGEYANAEAIRPFKLRLFNYNSANVPEGAPDVENMKPITGYMSINKPAKVVSSTTTVLHFLVPYAFLDTNDSQEINLICLYGIDRKDLSNNGGYCAYIYLTDPDNPDQFKPLEINDNQKENYSLSIEWELSVDNE